MGQARRNKMAGRNPNVIEEELMAPAREAVLGELKQGKPKPSIVVFDGRTGVTVNGWPPPRIVDDVTGLPCKPYVTSTYATLDEFTKTLRPDAQSLERVRLGLVAHPEDVIVCALCDQGVQIANVEMTAHAEGHKVTMEQVSEAYAAKRQGMQDLLREAIDRAIDVYGLDMKAVDDHKKNPTDALTTLVTKGLLNVVIDRTLKTREEGYHPAVMGVWPEGDDCGVGCWDTIEKFERTRQENTRHKAWKEQVREAAAAHPGSIVVCWPPDTLETPLSVTAKEAQSGYTVWAVDTKSMRIERCTTKEER